MVCKKVKFQAVKFNNMNGPFISAEIRWFSKERDKLLEFYVSLPETGKGMQEPARSDLYLKNGLVNTGVKIREGNHEIKVKLHDDVLTEIGRIEHWAKWSYVEKRNIFNTIDEGHLEEWMRIDKQRYKKNYVVYDARDIQPTGDTLAAQGCSIEFTELTIPSKQLKVYTLGCEAFSKNGGRKENLELILEYFGFNTFAFLATMMSCGYPEFLKSIE